MVPLHPFFAHIPLVLALFMPVVLWTTVILIKRDKVSGKSWWVPVIIQSVIVLFAYVALATGENEEDLVAQFISKRFISQHENMAEVFSGLSVLLLGVVMVVNFVNEKVAKKLRVISALFSFVPLAMGLYVGRLGGEIAYAHGGAEAYYGVSEDSDTESMGILPTPGMNTSESEFPVDELELNNPDADFEDFEREQGADPNAIESLPEDSSFSEDEEDRADEAE